VTFGIVWKLAGKHCSCKRKLTVRRDRPISTNNDHEKRKAMMKKHIVEPPLATVTDSVQVVTRIQEAL
jgi:hypothetical protein